MSETVESVFEQQPSLMDRARDIADDLLNSRLGRIAAAGVAAVGLMGALNSETSAEAQSAVPSVTLVCPDGTKDGPGRYGYAFIIENLTGTQSEGTNSIPSQASTKWVSAPGAKSIFPLDGSQENVELVVTQEKPFQQELKRETFRCSPNTTTTSTTAAPTTTTRVTVAPTTIAAVRVTSSVPVSIAPKPTTPTTQEAAPATPPASTTLPPPPAPPVTEAPSPTVAETSDALTEVPAARSISPASRTSLVSIEASHESGDSDSLKRNVIIGLGTTLLAGASGILLFGRRRRHRDDDQKPEKIHRNRRVRAV